MQPGIMTTPIDMSDEYTHIPIREGHQCYLCFHLGNIRYKYLVLPFGLMPPSWLFMKVIIQFK